MVLLVGVLVVMKISLAGGELEKGRAGGSE